MNDNLVYVKGFSSPPVDRTEVMRYARVRENSLEMEKLLDECIIEAEKHLVYKICYSFFDIKIEENEIDLGFTRTSSKSLIKTFKGCDRIVLFCATIGSGIDRLIAKSALVSPARAVVLQALGSERVEALCDEFCRYIAESVGECTRRFSPGYGDLPLEIQRDIFATLNPTRRIGVDLGDNLFMQPSKTVTAIIGIKCKL